MHMWISDHMRSHTCAQQLKQERRFVRRFVGFAGKRNNQWLDGYPTTSSRRYLFVLSKTNQTPTCGGLRTEWQEAHSGSFH